MANKFVTIIALFIFLIIFIIYDKNISKSKALLDVNFSELSVANDITDNDDKEIYLKNKTKFYIKNRTEFLLRFGYSYNESKLVTFQDKLNWLIIHESPEYKSYMADKIKLHDYAQKIIGKDICVPILKIYDNPSEINFDELPNKFILKLNHGSHMNLVCHDKERLDYTEAIKHLNKWKNRNFGFHYSE